MIDGLEDAEDYRGFEAAVIADYDARTTVERELVLRLTSLLWLRRIISIETDLIQIQAEICRARLGEMDHVGPAHVDRLAAPRSEDGLDARELAFEGADDLDQLKVGGRSLSVGEPVAFCGLEISTTARSIGSGDITVSWKQTVQTFLLLESIRIDA